LSGFPQQRAISHRPDLAGRVHLYSSRADMIEPELQSFSDYAAAHATHLWVRRAIDVISNHFSALPLAVFNKDAETLPAHPLTLPLTQGNDSRGPAQLWAEWTTHLLLGGEAFFEVVPDNRDRPVAFWPRRPDYISMSSRLYLYYS
jgi:phage portal protein BeeE